jgi:hypothetical protein
MCSAWICDRCRFDWPRRLRAALAIACLLAAMLGAGSKVAFAQSLTPVAHSPVVRFNNQTGSDTGASGSGPATPVSGTCHTNGVTTTLLQYSGPDLAAAGVLTGFVHVMWLNTASGRRFTEINTFTATTVTVEDNFNIPAGSPVACVVGGKRQTLSGSMQIGPDMKGAHSGASRGWQVAIEDTGVDYTLTSALDLSGAGTQGCAFFGVGSNRPIVRQTADTFLLNQRQCDVTFLHLQNSSATKTSAHGLQTPGNATRTYNNIIGGPSAALSFVNGIHNTAAVPNALVIWGNEIRFCSGAGIIRPGRVLHAWNYIHDNTVGVNAEATTSFFLWRNLIVNNTDDGIRIQKPFFQTEKMYYVIENVIDGNGGDGIDCAQGSASDCYGTILLSNQITNNGGFGINCTVPSNGCTTPDDRPIWRWNNLFGNKLGPLPAGAVNGEDQTSIDPGYVNRAARNYCTQQPVNPDGGPPGFGLFYPGTNTPSILRRGACQPVGPSGGGANIGI